jgi:hypothetical protein
MHRRDPLLDAERTLQPVDGARELGQDAIARGVGDAAAMLRDQAVGDLAMRDEEPQRARLIRVHQVRIASHVSEKDRGEAALDGRGSFAHWMQSCRGDLDLSS